MRIRTRGRVTVMGFDRTAGKYSATESRYRHFLSSPAQAPKAYPRYVIMVVK